MVTLGDYKHHEGTIYTVMVIARMAESEERMVVYAKNDGFYWVRSEKDFEEEVEWPDGVRRSRFVREESNGFVRM